MRYFSAMCIGISVLVAILVIGEIPAMGENGSDGQYAVVARIPGADGGWDFASVASGKLFVARSNGVMAIDIATQKVTDQLIEGVGVHGILPLPGTPYAISTNGKSANAFLFDRASGELEATFATGQSPDALLVEPKSGKVVIFNGKSHDATIVDVASRAVVGTIAAGGKPEVAVADGEGRVYFNLEDKAEIAVLDVGAGKIVTTYSLPGCTAPTGLAFDAQTGVLISACDNEVAKLIDLKTGKDLGTLKIGKGPDGVLLDEKRRLAFVPAGDGTLSVIALRSPNDIAVIASVPTATGARSGALDPATGKIYLPSAKFLPPEKEGERRKQVPGSFEILVVAPPG